MKAITRSQLLTISRAKVIHWHRRIGLAVALFIFLLASTGILLNHTSEWGLDKKGVNAMVISLLYDIELANHFSHFEAGDDLLTQYDGHIYLNGRQLITEQMQLVGAVWYQEILVIALERELILLTSEGEVIEKMVDIPLPQIEAIGRNRHGNVSLRGGDITISSVDDFITWQVDRTAALWSVTKPSQPAIEKEITHNHSLQTITLERLLLDIHSGRIFGSLGIYLMDLAAIAMIFLAATGIARWWNKQTNKNHKKSH